MFLAISLLTNSLALEETAVEAADMVDASEPIRNH